MATRFFRMVRAEVVALRLFSLAPIGCFPDKSSAGPTSYAYQTLESAWAAVRKYLPEADPVVFTVLVFECQTTGTVDLIGGEVRLE